VNTSPPTTGKTNRLAATTDRLFRISERGSSIRTELLAGISMFLASAYTIVVIPGMLADAGVPRGAATTALIIVAVLGTFAMGLFANLPLVLAPGLGGVALVAYTLVQNESVPFGVAMGIVFWSGILFLLLTVFGIRSLVTRIMPTNVRLAIGSGIGLYIAFIGFRSTGLVVGDGDGLVLGDLASPAALLALAGIVLLVALQARKVPGAFVIVIVAITLVGIPLGVTELPGSYLAPPDSPGPVAFDIDLIGALAPHYFPYLFAFFAAEFFSTTGVVLAVTEKIGEATGRKDAGLKRPFLVDSAAIAGGSFMGAPSVTTYLESAARHRGRRPHRADLVDHRRPVRRGARLHPGGRHDPLGRDGARAGRDRPEHARGLPQGGHLRHHRGHPRRPAGLLHPAVGQLRHRHRHGAAQLRADQGRDREVQGHPPRHVGAHALPHLLLRGGRPLSEDGAGRRNARHTTA
jgi:AGZA family xanthine/uracil permease-like MFS transporter